MLEKDHRGYCVKSDASDWLPRANRGRVLVKNGRTSPSVCVGLVLAQSSHGRQSLQVLGLYVDPGLVGLYIDGFQDH